MFGTNKLYLILFVVLLLLSMAGTVFLFQQSRDTRNRAVTSGQLICMPIDDSGNITNDKYHYNRIKVKNETNQEIRIKAQTNECDLQNNPSKCEIYKDAIPLNIAPGQELVVSQGLDSRVKYQYLGAGITLNLSTNTPCQKTIQLDVQKDKDYYGSNAINIPDCFNTTDNRVWEGGIAFTLKSNSQSCSITNCPPVNTTSPPSNLKIGDTFTLDYSSTVGLACFDLTVPSGTTKIGDVQVNQVNGVFHWRQIIKVNQIGSFTSNFTGNTSDSGSGVCPTRVNGDWCPASLNFSVSPNSLPSIPPTSTPTPPRPTATGIPPTNTPTPPRPTATGIPPTNTPTPPRPTATSSPTPTGTLVPTNTPTSSPMPTATIIPQPTSTTTYLASGPSPTTITTLPQTGLNFPIQGLTIVGVIVILFGLLVLL